ncbi:MAG: hypothetical protein CFH08_00033 [Alphaproteobacteria bacterium MarineAlpha3_Bin7]|nr:MAG: hypothetical protein CFH08_00033 [Alphaproteobacteria bacterium MarineAlpha3_Bin7]|tara:strand:- start:52 stop:561 length:510 start_codon:yes stop_codon:yes gene_type:complete
MAVIAEGISVVIKKRAIRENLLQGWREFNYMVPNQTLCHDSNIARVGFLSPREVGHFIDRLERKGLIFVKNTKAIDIAVVDQQKGPTTSCRWLDFGHFPYRKKDGTIGEISACWFREHGLFQQDEEVSRKGLQLSVPANWSFEGSLSDKYIFVPDEDLQSKKFAATYIN